MGVYDLLCFGCSHKHYTFPLTVTGKLRRNGAASVTGTYVVCLDCGKEFPYDWNTMKVLRSKSPTSEARGFVAMFSRHKVA